MKPALPVAGRPASGLLRSMDRGQVACLLRVLRACAARRPRRVFLEEAEIELWGLYRREQAQLVAEAAMLRIPPDGPEVRRARRAALRAWRARATECALLVACDGYLLSAALRTCLAAPVHLWPGTRALAAEAGRLSGFPNPRRLQESP
ncbi:MAG: hypothetical protein JNK02_04860 [Planctomycetes bacterium]|nr:hypothetical protein [Planctomycetota bacterium]